MTFSDLVREEASAAGVALADSEVEHVIWGMTGFPAFWNIPADGDTPAECFHRQVRRVIAKMADRGFAVVAAEYEREMEEMADR